MHLFGTKLWPLRCPNFRYFCQGLSPFQSITYSEEKKLSLYWMLCITMPYSYLNTCNTLGRLCLFFLYFHRKHTTENNGPGCSSIYVNPVCPCLMFIIIIIINVIVIIIHRCRHARFSFQKTSCQD